MCATRPPSHVIGTYESSQKGVFGREPLSSFGKAKMYLGYVMIVPIRVGLLIPFHLIMCTLISLCLIGAGPDGVEGCRATIFSWLAWMWMRGNLFLFGFYYIPTKGKKEVPPPDVSKVYIGNHCGWMEVRMWVWLAKRVGGKRSEQYKGLHCA